MHHLKTPFAVIAVVALLVLSACSAAPAAPAPAAAAPTAASQATEAPAKPAAASPTELGIAVVSNTPAEEPWNIAQLTSFERVAAAKPNGLTINIAHTENVTGDDIERVLREYADSGKYQIIWGQAYTDQVKKLSKEYPEILWVLAGAGNEGLGGNVYWTYVHVHEAAYLLGMIAGMETKSNVIGAVAAYPYDSVNDSINGYVDGAKAVNPDIKAKVTYIESWFDPAKAKEATYAQIAAGADFIYAERYGPFEAVAEKDALAFGHYVDQNSQSPDVVVSSTIGMWDGTINTVVDEWWKHVTEGKAYDGPKEPIWYGMKDSGSDIAPYHGFESKLKKETIDAVAKAKADIMAGTLTVPLKVDPVKSD